MNLLRRLSFKAYNSQDQLIELSAIHVELNNAASTYEYTMAEYKRDMKAVKGNFRSEKGGIRIPPIIYIRNKFSTL